MSNIVTLAERAAYVLAYSEPGYNPIEGTEHLCHYYGLADDDGEPIGRQVACSTAAQADKEGRRLAKRLNLVCESDLIY